MRIAILLLGATMQLATASTITTLQHDDISYAQRDADGAFFNPWYPQPERKRSFWSVRASEPWADQSAQRDRIQRTTADLAAIAQPPQAMQWTWIGHATFLIQYRGINILTDPFFGERASPVSFAGPKRHFPPAIRIEQLPPVDMVFISHNHYEHLDAFSVRRLGNGPLWFVPTGLKQWFLDIGVSPERIVEMSWWQQTQSQGITITATPLQHWSKRTLYDRNKSLWAGWHIDFGDTVVWFGGDTGYHPQPFSEIARVLVPIDLAFIPIGAYEPRWFMRYSHVNPDDAVQLMQTIGAKQAIGIHWGTIQLTAEDIDAPLRDLAIARNKYGIDDNTFAAMMIGETRLLPRNH